MIYKRCIFLRVNIKTTCFGYIWPKNVVLILTLKDIHLLFIIRVVFLTILLPILCNQLAVRIQYCQKGACWLQYSGREASFFVTAVVNECTSFVTHQTWKVQRLLQNGTHLPCGLSVRYRNLRSGSVKRNSLISPQNNVKKSIHLPPHQEWFGPFYQTTFQF